MSENITNPIDPVTSQMEEKLWKDVAFFDKKRHGSISIVRTEPSYITQPFMDCIWHFVENINDLRTDVSKTFVNHEHAAFKLYKKPRFQRKLPRGLYTDYHCEEDSFLFNIESYPEYESSYPGTVTIGGAGLEALEYETSQGPNEPITIVVNYGDCYASNAQILRRINELQGQPTPVELDFEKASAELEELMPDEKIITINLSRSPISCQVAELFAVLSRRDMFLNFVQTDSIMGLGHSKWHGDELWRFLWQMVLSKELVRRFEVKDEFETRFSDQIWASMIIGSRWMDNVRITLRKRNVASYLPESPPTVESKAQAEVLKNKGNAEFFARRYSKAVDLYSKAINIDPSNAVYHCNRSAALYAVENYPGSLTDAFTATELDPKYAKAWSRYGLAALKTEHTKKAIQAYEAAIEAAGSDATGIMHRGLAEAKARNEADLRAIEMETDVRIRDELRRKHSLQDFSPYIENADLHFHSRIFQQQIEGILLFAAIMKWPWVDEVRDYCHKAYSHPSGEHSTCGYLTDWWFGMVLPGRALSNTLMNALACCTESMPTYKNKPWTLDYGLSVPGKTYWRARSALGRVLGCIPGTVSLCGWIGPCPPVEFAPPLADKKTCCVAFEPRRVALGQTNVYSEQVDVNAYDAPIMELQPREDETTVDWAADIADPKNWSVPKPPAQQSGTYRIEKVELTHAGTTTEPVRVSRAQIIFKTDTSEHPITYDLATNPVFITLPACLLESKDAHEVHARELGGFDPEKVWPVEKLQELRVTDIKGEGNITINATAEGAEVVARAWCSQQGQNAIIRRAGGPCYTCAVRAARSPILQIGVVIWAS